jgi:WD40 repeat protein
VAFSSDGNWLVTVSSAGDARLWDPRTGAALYEIESEHKVFEDAAIAPLGDRVAIASAQRGVLLWEPKAGKQLWLPQIGSASQVAYANDGQLAVADGPNIWCCAPLPSLQGVPSCRRLAGHEAWVRDLNWTPDGQSLISGSADGTVRVWEVATGQARILEGHAAPVFDVAVSPDGNRIASASGDTTLRLWERTPVPPLVELAQRLEAATAERISHHTSDE